VKDPKNPQKQKEDRELIKFTGPTDSVYMKARDYVELDVGTGKHSMCACVHVCMLHMHVRKTRHHACLSLAIR